MVFFNALFGGGGVTSLELAQEKENLVKMVVDVKDTIEVIFDNKPFINISAARIHQDEKTYDEKYELAATIFPWLNLPYSFLGLLITAFAFGTLRLELSRIWCCGNHVPKHCGDNISEGCKKIH